MNGRRAIAGLCLLCALLASAVAAQSASAITGTTAVTCAKEGVQQVGVSTFNTAHCLPGEGAGEWEHYQIAQDTTTEVTVRSGSATTKMKATLGGVATTFTSTSLTGTGSMTNKKTAGGEHFAHGTVTLILSGVTVSPFTKCFVYTDAEPGVGAKGVLDTTEMTATTEGQGEKAKLTPKEGTVFTRFWLLDKNQEGAGGECTIYGTYTISGSVTNTPEGATIGITHLALTEQNTLKMGTGEPTIKAGIEGSLTLEGRANSGDTYKPLSVTTF